LLFPTIDFAIFFGIVFVFNWLLVPFERAWKVFMILASYVFYGWWDWRFVFLLTANTALTIAGARLVSRPARERPRRFVLAGTLAGELGLLGWFKYYGFLSVNVDNALHALGARQLFPLLQVTLPVGISFFTFMGLSYVIDVYRRDIEPAPWLDVAVFQAFFPHLVAGPIVRGSELLPQVAGGRGRDVRRVDLSRAAYLIFGGLFKKVVLSSYLSSAIADPVFANPSRHSGPEILLATYAYAVQIYCDFSGYTDIAIGVAMLLGFRFPQNFDAPYTATSLQDFWRRWHMTLSNWLRDYLYVPLGGNRGSRPALYRNIVITMVLGGLWHGAAWTFVAWGAFHGVGQSIGHFRRDRRASKGVPPRANGRLAVAWQRFATFQLVCLGWVFFRAQSLSAAMTMLRRLLTTWGPSPLLRWQVVAVVALGIALQYVPPRFPSAALETFSRLSNLAQGAVLGLALLTITTLGPAGVAPFIYYRF
jgi:D-alanyl-lipoteichoic acid acyltransferase DltB (MBOAT superfamily)